MTARFEGHGSSRRLKFDTQQLDGAVPQRPKAKATASRARAADEPAVKPNRVPGKGLSVREHQKKYGRPPEPGVPRGGFAGSWEAMFVSNVVASRQIERALSFGVSEDNFTDDVCGTAFAWIAEHFRRHASTPSVAAFREAKPKFPYRPDDRYDLPFLIDMMVNRRKFTVLEAAMVEVVGKLDRRGTAANENGDLDAALRVLRDRLAEIEDIEQNAGLAQSSLQVRRLDQIDQEPIEWLVPALVPLGELTVIFGPPGSSKGFLLQHLNSCTTRGVAFAPGLAACPKGEVLVVSAEESYSKVFKGRALAAGTVEKRVHVIDGVRFGDRRTCFTIADLDLVKRHLAAHPRTRLIIIDPLDAVIPSTNTIANNKVRAEVMSPLQQLAEDHNVAVVMIMHPRKEFSENTLHQLAGSIAFGAAVRSVLTVKRMKDDQGHCESRLLLPVKNNLLHDNDQIGLQYDVVDGHVKIARIISDRDEIEALMKPRSTMPVDESTDCADWVMEQLTDGEQPKRLLRSRASAVGYSGRRFDAAVQQLEADKRITAEQPHEKGRRGAGPLMLAVAPRVTCQT